jgi:hypothetical protein
MPFVPLILYAISQRFSAGAVRMCGPDRPVWRLIAYCALASCLMVAIQTAGRLTEARAVAKLPGAAAEAEIRRVLDAHKSETILMGAGSDEHLPMALLRHEAVFAGHPIGIDVASIMDYRKAGVAEPNLFRLVSELRERRGRRVLWILPHGTPFSITNIYDGQPLFSQRFRRDFDHAFTLQERKTFFDVYVEKTADEDLASDQGLGAADGMFR